MELHPGISCYLSLTDHCVPLKEQRFDVAIRVAPLKDENLSARRLGFLHRIVVGAKTYLARHGVPRTPEDLKRHNCIQFTNYARGDEWPFSDNGHLLSVRVEGRLRADDQEAVLESVLAGAGLALLPGWLVQAHIEQGCLEQVLSDFDPPRTPVHAVFPTPGAPPGKVRALVDFLHESYRSRAVLSADPG
jgi:DNA-binding transcriptional LysR family regulator